MCFASLTSDPQLGFMHDEAQRKGCEFTGVDTTVPCVHSIQVEIGAHGVAVNFEGDVRPKRMGSKLWVVHDQLFLVISVLTPLNTRDEGVSAVHHAG